MPNPVPLATKEEEERRAWVTAHHEVVRLIKDCFGDRFSNNEIFDRLKISRRTGYRALGNDERIGKAPGRKPKITEETIKLMIEYIENGNCSEVGNVWKHLAERFAPDCNPKTVQDAVKKSGFKNYRNQVKLEPLLNQEINEFQGSPQPEQPPQMQPQAQPLQTPVQQYTSTTVIDPTFQQNASRELLRQAIGTSPDSHVRTLLWEACTRYHEVEDLISSYLYPYVNSAPAPPAPTPSMHAFGQHNDETTLTAKRPRIAVCRRCQQSYDRSENTMENRQCLYHKGSPQKTDPTELGTIEDTPQAYTWSCCGGNGLVRGCCRAMHTTKKKRKYGKKRDATDAGLDENGDLVDGDHTPLEEHAAKILRKVEQAQLQTPQVESGQHETTQQYQQQHLDPLDSTPLTHHTPVITADIPDHKSHAHIPQQLTHSHQDSPFDDHLDSANIDASLQTLQRDLHQDLQQSSLSVSHPLSMHHVFSEQLQNYNLAQNTHPHHLHPSATNNSTSTRDDDYAAQLTMDMKSHGLRISSHATQSQQQAQQQGNSSQNQQTQSSNVQLPLEFRSQYAAVEQLNGQ